MRSNNQESPMAHKLSDNGAAREFFETDNYKAIIEGGPNTCKPWAFFR
jgi:hypothetical protein